MKLKLLNMGIKSFNKKYSIDYFTMERFIRLNYNKP